MTDGEVPAMTRNCILVVYQFVFGIVSRYVAKSSKMFAPNPSGAAKLAKGKFKKG
jgi:hypothetical protein